MVDRLFVYGTLRLGWKNDHARALARETRHVGEARIRGRLFRVAHYPGLVQPEAEDEWVTGDLFEGVSDELFDQLDEYESSDYRRQLSEVILADGRKLSAYLYLYLRPTDGLERISESFPLEQ